MRDLPHAMYFDTAFGSTFAWYHPPAEPATSLGVVLCPPIGSELMCSYHPLRELAHTLADSGVAVLRADYQGTGDATGQDEDPDRLSAWLGTIDAAIDQLRALGCEHVGLIGLRLGATLAAVAASRRKDVAGVVLWAPLKSGNAYAREMKMLALTESNPVSAKLLPVTEGAIEAGGFLLTASTLSELAAIDLHHLPAVAPRLLLISRDDMADSDKLATMLKATHVNWPGYADMMLAPHYATPAPETFSKIAAWIGEPHARSAKSTQPNRFEAEPSIDVAGSVREHAIRFGPDQALFGILAEPLHATPRATAIVLPNMGANSHVGPNRMYVRMARRWAALGYHVLRFDLGGVGESEPRADQSPNAPYSWHGVRDFDLGIAEVRRRTGATEVIAIGMCSGAYVAFHAGLLGSAMTRQILVNPQAFYWKEGDSLDAAPATVAAKVQAYNASMRTWASWKKLLTGRARYGALVVTLGRRVRDLCATWLKRAGSRLGLLQQTDDLGHDLRVLADRNIDVLLIYSENDAGLVYLKDRAARDVSRLISNGQLEIETIAHADHTFTRQEAQSRLIAVMTSHLTRSM